MILEVHNLYTSYGLSQILFGISLDVHEGECVALLGRNGVGKTTTLRSIMGLTPPRQGEIRYKDHNITGLVVFGHAGTENGTVNRGLVGGGRHTSHRCDFQRTSFRG